MTMIEKFREYSEWKEDPESLNTAFSKLTEDVKINRPEDREWYAFAMFTRSQDWFKDPERLQHIVKDGHLPEIFSEAMSVVTAHNIKYTKAMYPALSFVRQNYILCISNHICDPKKEGKTLRVIYTDPKYPDESVAIPNGWLKDPDEVLVQTLVILPAIRGGTIIFKHDAPVKERKMVCAFYFDNKGAQYSLRPEALEEKGFIGKHEIGYEAIV